MSLPILTLPDPKVTGEGVLDPLGLSTIADRLADQVLPGLRARMSRPRFLTAMAVCAAICDGIEDRIADDGVTQSHIVFEWLVVEGFVRSAKRAETIRTPGMHKAQAAKDSGEPMNAAAYLRVPTIFGFHGIYRPLARQAGIVDHDMRLADHGYGLVKEWQSEQRLAGFLPTSIGGGAGTAARALLRSAVEDAIRKGYSDRSTQWRGWSVIAETLVPARVGAREAAFIHRLLTDGRSEPRGEVFHLVRDAHAPDEMTEAELIKTALIQQATPGLRRRLLAISYFEDLCTRLEDAFDWIRYVSTMAGARAIGATDYAAVHGVQDLVRGLQDAFRRAEDGVADLSDMLSTQQEMAALSSAFDDVRTAPQLFEALLHRHHEIQQGKQPDGKRDWFERGPDGATFVRVPYRTTTAPEPRKYWNRPYRVDAVRSFLDDLKVGLV